MSKKDLLKVSLVLTLVACASSAYATATITATTAIGNSSFAPSANVTLTANSTAGSGTYQAMAAHASGNRTYFGTSSDPKIYYSTSPVSALPADPTGWSSL